MHTFYDTRETYVGLNIFGELKFGVLIDVIHPKRAEASLDLLSTSCLSSLGRVAAPPFLQLWSGDKKALCGKSTGREN